MQQDAQQRAQGLQIQQQANQQKQAEFQQQMLEKIGMEPEPSEEPEFGLPESEEGGDNGNGNGALAERLRDAWKS